MAFKHIVALIVTLSAFTIAPAASVRAEPLPVVGFGDSLMAGFGLGPGEGFTDRLQAALRAKGHDIDVANAGVSGDTTSGGLARLDWSVPDGTKLVILELGANDMLRGVDPALVEQNLDAMLSRLKARGIPVVLVGMVAAPNLGHAYGEQFGAIYPKLAEKYGATLYPFFLDGVAGDKSMQLEDGMHPNAAGVERMVERFLPTMEKAIAGLPAAQ
ncbi:acyl-CoA thioesterase [Mesorhizobium sp. Root552]|jgi:acyl-CoA thioesterase-1|uniref:arylesterase n=1 Tax=Mesorhizobium sp. Root552 TaxID=1736555 RepID=UPI0006F26329|nr:arylesterase [Mesorhizobium sp. Root552]KQZ29539.1 acyl-CoA thioesterase [Mesorhizobium sp. Root552]